MTYYILFLLTLNGQLAFPNKIPSQDLCAQVALEQAKSPEVLRAHCVEVTHKIVFQNGKTQI